MTTKLDKPLKRELDVGGKTYTLTLTPDGMKLVEKGRRIGYELPWKALITGDAAIATALNATLEKMRR
jgi:hypothetical protein